MNEKDIYYSLLSKNNKEFQEANSKNSEFGDLPDGNYTAKLMKMELKEGRNKNVRLCWHFKVTDPEFNNRMIFIWTPLEGEYLWVTKSYLEKCGFNLENLTDIYNVFKILEEEKPEIVGSIRLVTKARENGKQQNPYLNDILFPYIEKNEMIKGEDKMSDRLLKEADLLQVDKQDNERAIPKEIDNTESKEILDNIDIPF